MHLETAEAHVGEAAEADPRTHPYGLYSIGPTILPIGLFCWFKTPAELVRGVVLLAHIDDRPEPDEWAALIATAAPDETKVKADCSAALCHLDDRLIWAGTFDELSQGSGKFAAELRRDFRLTMDDDALTTEEEEAAIRADEVDDWIEHLRNYGH
jgi:hypothetical protein